MSVSANGLNDGRGIGLHTFGHFDNVLESEAQSSLASRK